MLVKVKKISAVFSLASWAAFTISPVMAAPGKLAKDPLFLGSSVQPNILWLLDDSGSMNHEILRTTRSLIVHSGLRTTGNLDLTPGNTGRQLELCPGYNAMAFDPNRTYTPWSGTNNSGQEYGDRTLATAYDNPYVGSTDNISNSFYVVWNDSDNDGEYDNGECAWGNRVLVDGSSPAALKTNFANWYSYYRKRDYVAKKAVSDLIQRSTARMGLAVLWGGSKSIGAQIENINNISESDPTIRSQNATNKSNLMQELFRSRPRGGTPLRRTLERAGDYFEMGITPSNNLFGFTPSPTSPILPAADGGECQQNFAILLSDGFWNRDDPNVGNADANTSNPFDGKSYADNDDDTLADVAMHYYKRDLAPSLENKVAVIQGVDENNAQHMVTYTVAFGVDGNLTANPPNRNDPFSWPQVQSGTRSTIDDMRHAAWNGRGEFLNASSPQTLIRSLSDAIQSIGDREGTASAVSFNSTSLQTNSLVFQSRFDSGSWTGDLEAIEITRSGVSADPKWFAAKKLRDMPNPAANRNIITFNGTRGVPFRWPADYTTPSSTGLSSEQVNDLLADSSVAANTSVPAEIVQNQAYGKRILAWHRGDNSNESGVSGGTSEFRSRRGNLLGDIVASSPAFVGKPSKNYPDGIESTPYSDFIQDKANRPGRVYVGANDGMVHSFKADNGNEAFAYIPGFIFSDKPARGLHYLADQEYNHQAYIDGSPVAADVWVGSWRTYLVGGVRAGGKGVYVLDVTNPNSLNESNAHQIVKMEFTDNNLGYTFSQPQVAKTNSGKWAMIFGNGYNNDPTGDGKARLYIVYLDGSGVEEIIADEGSITNNDCNHIDSVCNGLSTPITLDLDGNGTVDRAYAGDVLGNMWAFDLSSTNDNQWQLAYSNKPFFRACHNNCFDSHGRPTNRQPITSKPAVVAHTKRSAFSTSPNLMVFFGTGQYIAEGDNFSEDKQSAYGIWDSGTGDLERSDLLEQTVTESTRNGRQVRNITNTEPNYAPLAPNTEYGWFWDLQTTKERAVTNPAAVGDILFFNSLIPDHGGSCSFGGYGWLMGVDLLSGGDPNFAVVDLNNDGTFDDNVVGGIAVTDIPAESRFISNRRVTVDSSGKIRFEQVQPKPPTPGHRTSWTTTKQ